MDISGRRPIYDLLYIEDHAYDLEVVRAVLKDRNLRLRLNSVANPQEALEYMHRRGRYVDSPLPDLVILDLQANPDAGREFLRQRMNHPLYRFSRLVVLATDEEAATNCYDLGASACIAKPQGLDQLASLIVEIEKFWFHLVVLPPPEWRLEQILRKEQEAGQGRRG
jgi:CheY-like chemotaxis protein